MSDHAEGSEQEYHPGYPTTAGPFRCECGEVFQTRAGFEAHVEDEHPHQSDGDAS